MLLEEKNFYSVSFQFNEKEYKYSGTLRETLGGVVEFLLERGFTFQDSFFTKPISYDEIVSNPSYKSYLRSFYKLKNGKYFYIGGNIQPALNKIVNMLNKFGIKDIKTEGFETQSSKIKKLAEINLDDEFDPELEPIEEEPTQIRKPKIFNQNPFGGKPLSSAILVLGESGAGKSTTIEGILITENHYFEFIIPTAATTGILAQFSPLKQRYVISRLGRMLVEASKNPQKLYTAVFDEMHKSNVIEMINDELLQAVSKKRNRGRRFISLDQDTAEIYEESELEDDKRGNLTIPDNFGFIFISSKPALLLSNPDFANRVDIVILKSWEEEIVKTSDQLISKILSTEEKERLIGKRND